MDWDDIQREFDRVNEMSCKPVGLQKYKVGHIFDENMSVKWNREKLEEENKKYNDEVARLNTEKNKGFCRANDLVFGNGEKIMDAVRKDVRRLVNKELEAANKRFPQFASPHEGQNVVREELEEAERAIVPLKLYIETRMWNMVKANQTVPKDDFKAIREAAVNLAVEAIQVAAMAKKFEHGQRNNWPGAREDSHGEEKNRAGSGNSDNHHEPTGGGSGKDRL